MKTCLEQVCNIDTPLLLVTVIYTHKISVTKNDLYQSSINSNAQAKKANADPQLLLLEIVYANDEKSTEN